MDVLIPFQHSINQDEELRMTLRTMDKHLNGIGHVWIVGDTPKWQSNPAHLTVIPIGNRYTEWEYRDRNMVNKILGGFHYNSSRWKSDEDVLVAHDDNFITSPCDIDIWPWYNCGRSWSGKGDYANTEANTHVVLGTYRVENYDIHCPHRMNRNGIEHFKCLDWTVKNGYCIKTIYCIRNGVNGEFYWDLKINGQFELEEVERMVTAGRRFFSCGDKAFTPGVRQWLLNRFPDKSKYEL